jgi:hypothetical protein
LVGNDWDLKSDPLRKKAEMVEKQRPLYRVETVSLGNELTRTDCDDDGNRRRLTHDEAR